MIRRDAHSKSKVLAFIQENGHPADENSSAIDITGYMCVQIVAIMDGHATAYTSDNKCTMSVTHSTDGTTFTDVPTDDLLGGAETTAGVLKVFDKAHATATAYRWGYRGDGSHLKLKLAFTNGVAVNRNVTMMVIGMDPWDFPTADQN